MPFSHRRHAVLKIGCAHCHAAAAERMTLPVASACMVCHQAVKADTEPIRKLAALPRDASPFAVPRKLPDFVFFSHSRHTASKVSCADCHGASDAPNEPRIDAKMKVCVDCHRARRTSTACTICHELSQ